MLRSPPSLPRQPSDLSPALRRVMAATLAAFAPPPVCVNAAACTPMFPIPPVIVWRTVSVCAALAALKFNVTIEECTSVPLNVVTLGAALPSLSVALI